MRLGIPQCLAEVGGSMDPVFNNGTWWIRRWGSRFATRLGITHVWLNFGTRWIRDSRSEGSLPRELLYDEEMGTFASICLDVSSGAFRTNSKGARVGEREGEGGGSRDRLVGGA